ncbi:MAG: HAMP domain-containing protein [Verrucomicrobia bacterium]|nr:HAMP domain-containing protein [Verrucomicrobiota bacterium]
MLTPADEARGFYFAVWRMNQEPKFFASAGAPPDIPVPPDEIPKGQRQRGMFREVFVTSNPGDAVLVGRSIAADRAELHRLGLMLAGGGLAIFAVTLLIGGWLVQRALRPIRDISDAAAKIAAGDLARRIDTRDTESELGAMARVLNETLRGA